MGAVHGRLAAGRARQRAGRVRPSIGQRIAIRILRVGRDRRRTSDLDRARVAGGAHGRWPVLRCRPAAAACGAWTARRQDRRRPASDAGPGQRRRLAWPDSGATAPGRSGDQAACTVRAVSGHARRGGIRCEPRTPCRPSACGDIPLRRGPSSRRSQLVAAADEEAVRRLPGDTDRASTIGILEGRRDRHGDPSAPESGRRRDRVVEILLAERLLPSRGIRGCSAAEKPRRRPSGYRWSACIRRDCLARSRRRSPTVPRSGCSADTMPSTDEVRLAARCAGVFIADGQLRHGAHRDANRRRGCASKIDFAAEPEVAELVADPLLADERVVHEDAAAGAVARYHSRCP